MAGVTLANQNTEQGGGEVVSINTGTKVDTSVLDFTISTTAAFAAGDVEGEQLTFNEQSFEDWKKEGYVQKYIDNAEPPVEAYLLLAADGTALGWISADELKQLSPDKYNELNNDAEKKYLGKDENGNELTFDEDGIVYSGDQQVGTKNDDNTFTRTNDDGYAETFDRNGNLIESTDPKSEVYKAPGTEGSHLKQNDDGTWTDSADVKYDADGKRIDSNASGKSFIKDKVDKLKKLQEKKEKGEGKNPDVVAVEEEDAGHQSDAKAEMKANENGEGTDSSTGGATEKTGETAESTKAETPLSTKEQIQQIQESIDRDNEMLNNPQIPSDAKRHIQEDLENQTQKLKDLQIQQIQESINRDNELLNNPSIPSDAKRHIQEDLEIQTQKLIDLQPETAETPTVPPPETPSDEVSTEEQIKKIQDSINRDNELLNNPSIPSDAKRHIQEDLENQKQKLIDLQPKTAETPTENETNAPGSPVVQDLDGSVGDFKKLEYGALQFAPPSIKELATNPNGSGGDFHKLDYAALQNYLSVSGTDNKADSTPTINGPTTFNDLTFTGVTYGDKPLYVDLNGNICYDDGTSAPYTSLAVANMAAFPSGWGASYVHPDAVDSVICNTYSDVTNAVLRNHSDIVIPQGSYLFYDKTGSNYTFGSKDSDVTLHFNQYDGRYYQIDSNGDLDLSRGIRPVKLIESDGTTSGTNDTRLMQFE